jgi:hypothetical protein
MAKVLPTKGKSIATVKGGTGHMISEQEAGPQKPGATSNGGANAGETSFAQGGKTKMFGYSGSKPAKPC